MSVQSSKKGLLALTPIAVMLSIYLVGSLVTRDFYSIPIAVAFLVASVYAVCITRGMPLQERVGKFSQGAASAGIMNMIWIFVLAGAFSVVAKHMGAIDAAVNITLDLVPADYIPAGIFVAACFISMAIGTSVGTIVALMPIVTELAGVLNCGTPWLVAIVVGGAFFGDNLSFISDTTIAATQTQQCSMRSKFMANILLVTPAAVVTLFIYIFSGEGMGSPITDDATLADVLKCMPYLLVIVLALFGMNVLLVLAVGIVAAGATGLFYASFTPVSFLNVMGDGVMGMAELIIVTMLAGGMLELVRLNGGLDFIVRLVTSSLKGRRSAEFSICALTALSNVCTANNTIAILTVGDISRDISRNNGIAPRRSASLLDTSSCFVQGMLPYGAQLLTAAKYAGVSPLEIMPHLYYPLCVGAVLLISILVGKRKRRSL